MTKLQEKIYNSHLAISRKMRNKPFRIRKNFSSLETSVVDKLAALERFFLSLPSVNIDEYFTSPYEIFEDDDYFDLDFYLTSKAKKAYSQYMKKIEISDPDTEASLKRLIDGLKFVKTFCREKNLTLEKYHVYMESNLPCIIEHLKNHNINMYCLHALGITKIDVENRVLDFIFSDFWTTFQKTKNKFFLSGKMKELAKQATTKIQQQLKQ